MMTVDMGIDELKPGLSKMFGDNRTEFKPVYPTYMQKVTTSEFFEEYAQSGGFQDIPLLDEGDYMNFAKPNLGDKVRLQPERRQLAFAITKVDKQFNRVNKVERAMKRLARAQRRTDERVAAVPFNFAFDSTNRPMTDGQPLCSTAHVRLDDSVVSNRPATDTDLNPASLEDAIVNFMQLTDHDGTPINLSPKYLLVHPQNAMNARRILGSSAYYGTAGVSGSGTPTSALLGVKNILQDFDLVIVVNVFLTDPDAWFLLADKNDTEIIYVTNEAPTDRMFEDPFTEDSVYSISFSSIAGAVSDIGVYGSPGG